MAGEQGADLTGFLEAAGRSLADAQGSLSGERPVDVPTTVAISEAELEVKTTVERGPGGLVLRTISTADIAKGGITPGLVSTVRIRYVAVADDTIVPPSERPTRTPDKAIDDVRGRDDVRRLERILGGLRYEAIFVPSTQRWLVTARDPEDRVVREVVVPDRKTR